MPQNDSPLVERCVRKDPLAWAELVKRYSGLITISIENIFRKYSYPYSKPDVDDVRQNILFVIWKGDKLKAIKNRRDISYWLAIVSGNMALDYIRSRASKESYDTVSMYEKDGENFLNKIVESVASGRPTPLDDTTQREISKSLTEYIDELSHTEQMSIKLSIFHEKTNTQIARITHRPVGTISSAIKRAKDELRRRLKKYLQ